MTDQPERSRIVLPRGTIRLIIRDDKIRMWLTNHIVQPEEQSGALMEVRASTIALTLRIWPVVKGANLYTGSDT